MKAIFETRGNQQVNVHYVNADVPGVAEENLEGFLSGLSDLSLEEILQDQEGVYQSLQANNSNDKGKASASTNSNLDHVQNGGERWVAGNEGESSQVGNAQSQLVSDEAFARALQELENRGITVSFSETTETATETETTTGETNPAVNVEVHSAGTSSPAVREDNIDPDNMTYEELQSLTEAVGTESRGLSEELISYLPTFKYKTRPFSRKDKHEECVICIKEYKHRDVLTTLPCQHMYHSECVTKWLKQKKVCPVCNDEVFG